MKAIAILVATVLLVGGCLSDRASPSTSPAGPLEPCQLTLTPGRTGAAAGTMYLSFAVELAGGSPCQIAVWPAVQITDAAGLVLAQGPRDLAAIPRAQMLETTLPFHLGWASWCGPEPTGPMVARIGFLLNLYDPFVLGPVARFVWRCPTPRLIEGYRRHVRDRHLDVGPGTGFFLDRSGLPAGAAG